MWIIQIYFALFERSSQRLTPIYFGVAPSNRGKGMPIRAKSYSMKSFYLIYFLIKQFWEIKSTQLKRQVSAYLFICTFVRHSAEFSITMCQRSDLLHCYYDLDPHHFRLLHHGLWGCGWTSVWSPEVAVLDMMLHINVHVSDALTAILFQSSYFIFT